jgi:hypothetical protein
MYTDANGNETPVLYCVVRCNGYTYFVDEIFPDNSGRINKLKLRNGSVVVHAKPEECEVVL